jgi:hypothetical protein
VVRLPGAGSPLGEREAGIGNVVEIGAAIPNRVKDGKVGPVATQPDVLGVAWVVEEGIAVGTGGGTADGPIEGCDQGAPTEDAPPREEPFVGAAKEAALANGGCPVSREGGRIDGDAPDGDKGAVVRGAGQDVFPGVHGKEVSGPHR